MCFFTCFAAAGITAAAVSLLLLPLLVSLLLLLPLLLYTAAAAVSLLLLLLLLHVSRRLAFVCWNQIRLLLIMVVAWSCNSKIMFVVGNTDQDGAQIPTAAAAATATATGAAAAATVATKVINVASNHDAHDGWLL